MLEEMKNIISVLSVVKL